MVRARCSVAVHPPTGLTPSFADNAHTYLCSFPPRFRGHTTRRLLPIDTLAAVIINEAVTTTGVYYYLAIAQRDAVVLQLPFPQLRPRLADLLEPYRAARRMVPASMPAWPSPAVAEQLRAEDALRPPPSGLLDSAMRLLTGK